MSLPPLLGSILGTPLNLPDRQTPHNLPTEQTHSLSTSSSVGPITPPPIIDQKQLLGRFTPHIHGQSQLGSTLFLFQTSNGMEAKLHTRYGQEVTISADSITFPKGISAKDVQNGDWQVNVKPTSSGQYNAIFAKTGLPGGEPKDEAIAAVESARALMRGTNFEQFSNQCDELVRKIEEPRDVRQNVKILVYDVYAHMIEI